MSKKDANQTALAIVRITTGEDAVPATKKGVTARQKAGRKGGLKGGKTRMESLTEDQRRELSASGVAARKGKTPPIGGAAIKK